METLDSGVGINIQKRGLSLEVMEGLSSFSILITLAILFHTLCSLMLRNGLYLP